MKNFFLKILNFKLRWLTKKILRKYQPRIIGVTGSVGKTTTKEAIYQVLQEKFDVRRSVGSYNNEIGVPLTVIGRPAAGKNIFAWIGILFAGLRLIILPAKYPDILILELGVDQPGDMDYLLEFVRPNIGVITAISDIPVHLEYFKSVTQLAAEKAKLVKSLAPDGLAILNGDDPRLGKLAGKLKCQVVTFGQKKGVDLQAENLQLGANLPNGLTKTGLTFRLNYNQSFIPVRLPHILSDKQALNSLAAVAVGQKFNLNLVDITKSLSSLKPTPGRMNLIPGIKYSQIIDDSYNSSPDACLAALETLKELKVSGKKIAALGDMLELGPKTEEAHRLIGEKAAKIADDLITVGERARFIADAAKKAGLPENKIHHFEESPAAGKFIDRQIIDEGDLILVKGSRRMEMEEITLEIMADPEKADEILVKKL